MLPQLLTAAKNQKGMDEDILILTATSGDTGKAALAGFCDVDGVPIPENLTGLEQKAERHTDVIAKDQMLGYVTKL